MLLCEAFGCGRNNNQRSGTHRPPAADPGTAMSIPVGPQSGSIVSDVTPTLRTLQHQSSMGGGASAPARMMRPGGPGTGRTGAGGE